MKFKDRFVGIEIKGFCGGRFGSSSYFDKTIIASGKNWIVSETSIDTLEFAQFKNHKEMSEVINEYGSYPSDSDNEDDEERETS